MKTIPEKYECEICGRQFSTADEAIECENKKAPVYPIGMIYGNHTPDAFYSGITFAIAKVRLYGHLNDSALWACRPKGNDSLGKEMCGGGNFLNLGDHDAKLDHENPTFKRMVEYLKKEGIPITIWNGKEPVPFDAS